MNEWKCEWNAWWMKAAWDTTYFGRVRLAELTQAVAQPAPPHFTAGARLGCCGWGKAALAILCILRCTVSQNKSEVVCILSYAASASLTESPGVLKSTSCLSSLGSIAKLGPVPDYNWIPVNNKWYSLKKSIVIASFYCKCVGLYYINSSSPFFNSFLPGICSKTSLLSSLSLSIFLLYLLYTWNFLVEWYWTMIAWLDAFSSLGSWGKERYEDDWEGKFGKKIRSRHAGLIELNLTAIETWWLAENNTVTGYFLHVSRKYMRSLKRISRYELKSRRRTPRWIVLGWDRRPRLNVTIDIEFTWWLVTQRLKKQITLRFESSASDVRLPSPYDMQLEALALSLNSWR